jgi:leucyl aminopeptidase
MDPLSSAELVRRPLDCLALPVGDRTAAVRPVHLLRPAGLARFLADLPPARALFLEQSGFTAVAGELRLLAGEGGLAGAVLGLGEQPALHVVGALPGSLPERTIWRLDGAPAELTPAELADATLAFCLGAYAPVATKPGRRHAPLLEAGESAGEALELARAWWMVRDLINLPANRLGPLELAQAALAVAEAGGAAAEVIEGEALAARYPAVAAVGRGSVRAPCVVRFDWRGSAAGADAPLISLCGKGVCFDTGGYDLKPSAAMLRMKKDMGGAAIVLGVARLVMQADLPIRLAVRIGCVENAVTGDAMRPSDILRTRRGLSVEVGNTDAEGRLVLCDLLAEASDELPALLIDCATLTGAARVALGPDIPLMCCNDDAIATRFLAAGLAVHDSVWRLPLWPGYESWLNSTVADLSNVSGKPMAGAIIAGLFLQRFVKPGVPWVHFDLYAWNDQARPGRPEGGEAQAMRCIVAALRTEFCIA